MATFAANRHQYVGFGAGTDGIASGSIFNTDPWAMFGTGAGGTSVLARVNVTGTLLDFTVPGSLLGTAHKYRVDWKTTSVDFYVDDALVHTETATVPGPMRVAVSDLDVGGLALSVDWIHVTPYASSGSFTSRVYDGGAVRDLGADVVDGQRAFRHEPPDVRAPGQHAHARRVLDRRTPRSPRAGRCWGAARATSSTARISPPRFRLRPRCSRTCTSAATALPT